MDRRTALGNLTAAAALFGVSANGAAKQAPLPSADLRVKDADAYWTRIRNEQLLLPEWRAYLNNGSLGVAPKPVVQAVADEMEHGASLVDNEYPRWGYETLDNIVSYWPDSRGAGKTKLRSYTVQPKR